MVLRNNCIGSGSRPGGNVKAITIVFDRLEGRVGIRSGEADPASDVARQGVQQAIEDIVAAFTEAKLALPDDSGAHDSPADSASDGAPVMIDAEAPRGSARRTSFSDSTAASRAH